jgi:hypothetical protein
MIQNATKRTEDDDDEKESVRQTAESGRRRKKGLGFRSSSRARALAGCSLAGSQNIGVYKIGTYYPRSLKIGTVYARSLEYRYLIM